MIEEIGRGNKEMKGEEILYMVSYKIEIDEFLMMIEMVERGKDEEEKVIEVKMEEYGDEEEEEEEEEVGKVMNEKIEIIGKCL